MLFQKGLEGYAIPKEYQSREGRTLSLWRDAGWGQLVAKGKYEESFFSDQLVEACVEMIDKWKIEDELTWVSYIPSLNNPNLVRSFAERLAAKLDIPFYPAIVKVRNNSPQKSMQNSFQQAKNLDGAFKVDLFKDQEKGPCLLVDDIVDSRWTFTVISALLQHAGCQCVYPLALALNSPRMD